MTAPKGSGVAMQDFRSYRVFLFLLLASVALSAFDSLRVGFGPFKVHVFLILLLPSAIIALLYLGRPPWLLAMPICLLFVCAFGAASLQPGNSGEWLIRIAAFLATIAGLVLLVRSWKSFQAAASGFAVGMMLLGIRAWLVGGDSVRVTQGLNPFEGVGNRNAYSLYALPAVILAVWLAANPRAGRYVRVLNGVAAIAITSVLISSGNRSGWLGLGLVLVFVLVWPPARQPDNRLRNSTGMACLLGVLLLSVYYLVQQTYGFETFSTRLDATVTGADSTSFRLDLISVGFGIALDNPVFGVGPDALNIELATALGIDQPRDSHNALVLIGAGSGAIGFCLFALLVLSIWIRPIRAQSSSSSEGARDAHNLLRAMLLLFILRGFFGSEVISSPGFACGIGLALGLAITEGCWCASPARSPTPPPALSTDAT